jgi:hypothetical protein
MEGEEEGEMIRQRSRKNQNRREENLVGLARNVQTGMGIDGTYQKIYSAQNDKQHVT